MKTKNLNNIEYQEYEYLKYFEGVSKNIDELYTLNDMTDEFVTWEEGGTVYDAIARIVADYTPLYSYDIWDDASKISNFIEEFIEEKGLHNNSLSSTFQWAIVEYNTQAIYENIDAVIYNYIVRKLDNLCENEYDEEVQMVRDIEEEDIEKILIKGAIDYYSDFEFIDDIITEYIEEYIAGGIINE